MEKERQQDIKKIIRKTYGKIALQDNNEPGSFSGSCCAPGCCSGGDSLVSPSEGGKVIKFRGKSEKLAERMILFVCVENRRRD
jgi:hypothetical protein